jgi:hypothetical protein
MQIKSALRLVTILAFAAMLWPHRAAATTFVLLDEEELATQSTAVVSGWVTGVETSLDDATGGVNTYVTIEPADIIAGSLPEGEIVLREPGGEVSDRSEKIFGAPEYSIGEHVVAFLSQHLDGSLRTTGMAMGKYQVDATRNDRVTLSRSFGRDVTVIDRATRRVRRDTAAQAGTLADFVHRVRAATSRRPGRTIGRPIHLIPPEVGTTVPHNYQSPFTYLGSPSRWFEPDLGIGVEYLIDPAGDPRVGPSRSRAAVASALAAWTNVPASGLVLADGGLLSGPLPFAGCEGGNRIVFNDPFNEISDPNGCGGILAIGGYCSSSEATTVNGTSFRRIRVGKVVFNNGWDQCSMWNECNLAEVATHEIGHTIGLGHSADTTATLAAAAHFDGRCAGLRADDVAAAQFIYPEGSVPPPTSPLTPQPTATFTPTPPPPTPIPSNPTGVSNDTCSGATAVEGAPYNHTMVTSNAAAEASGPSPSCGNGSRARSVWYRYAPSGSGTVNVDTFGSSYDTILAAFTGSCNTLYPVAGACNDDSSGRQSRISFPATGGTTYYFLVTSYATTSGTLSFHLTSQNAAGTATPTRTFTPRPPTPTATGPRPTATFTVRVPSPTPTLRAPTPTATSTSAPPPTPGAGGAACPNDSCTNPMDVTTTPFRYSMVTTSATADASDPAPPCGNRSRAKSVWFRYTPPSNGSVVANTYGSNYDTLLAAFTKPDSTFYSVAGACNDDSSGTQSRIAFQATAGVSYYFLVTAYSNNGGNLVFQLTFQGTGNVATPTPTSTSRPPTPTFTRNTDAPPTPTPSWTPQPQLPAATPTVGGVPNDSCSTATAVGTLPSYSSVNTTRATAESSDPSPVCGNRSRGKSVWYRFTSGADMTLTATTLASNYDTILAVYTGSCGALSALPGGCNDDAGSPQSRVAFRASAGVTYYFLVTAYANNGGNLVLQLRQ